jgi:hypothetical protein
MRAAYQDQGHNILCGEAFVSYLQVEIDQSPYQVVFNLKWDKEAQKVAEKSGQNRG